MIRKVTIENFIRFFTVLLNFSDWIFKQFVNVKFLIENRKKVRFRDLNADCKSYGCRLHRVVVVIFLFHYLTLTVRLINCTKNFRKFSFSKIIFSGKPPNIIFQNYLKQKTEKNEIQIVQRLYYSLGFIFGLEWNPGCIEKVKSWKKNSWVPS